MAYAHDTMVDLKSIRSIALDISEARSSFQHQDAVAGFIWALLPRNYQIYLFTTNTNEDLDDEDFQHPRLAFLSGEMPPSEKVLQQTPDLLAPTTLWITEDRQMLSWITQNGLSFATRGQKTTGHSEGLRFGRLSELAALLDPTAFVMDEIAAIVREHHRIMPGRPLVVGIGGPPMSGYKEFSVDLRRHLEAAGLALVELMDLSSLLSSCDDVASGGTASDPWKSTKAGEWVIHRVLRPLRDGERVYIEQRPHDVPRDFEAHFPLFISEESTLLVFGEMPFSSPLVEWLDLSILLEVTPEEATRRAYEIPENEDFDARFTRQYMEKEGRIYWDYLRANQLPQRASIRVDANREHAFFLSGVGHEVTPSA